MMEENGVLCAHCMNPLSETLNVFLSNFNSSNENKASLNSHKDAQQQLQRNTAHALGMKKIEYIDPDSYVFPECKNHYMTLTIRRDATKSRKMYIIQADGKPFNLTFFQPDFCGRETFNRRFTLDDLVSLTGCIRAAEVLKDDIICSERYALCTSHDDKDCFCRNRLGDEIDIRYDFSVQNLSNYLRLSNMEDAINALKNMIDAYNEKYTRMYMMSLRSMVIMYHFHMHTLTISMSCMSPEKLSPSHNSSNDEYYPIAKKQRNEICMDDAWSC